MHGNRPALALYERAETALPDSPIADLALDDTSLIGDVKRAVSAVGYDILPGF
ncbi:MAG: hypothetical protein ACOCV2_09370 [Persicimonas sp.]